MTFIIIVFALLIVANLINVAASWADATEFARAGKSINSRIFRVAFASFFTGAAALFIVLVAMGVVK